MRPRLALLVQEGLRAVRDPYLRGDSVAAVAELTGDRALWAMRERMRATAEGRRVLVERPLLGPEDVDLKRLRGLPSDSLGATFARYLDWHGFQFGKRPVTRFIHDEELAFVMQRYRNVHDVLHALYGVPVSVFGEVGLKWFEMVQTGLPMNALAAFSGCLRVEDTENLLEFIGWNVQNAKRSEFFMNIIFEELWEEKLVDLRKKFKVKHLPKNLPSLDATFDTERRPALMKHYRTCMDKVKDAERAKPFREFLSNLGNSL